MSTLRRACFFVPILLASSSWAQSAAPSDPQIAAIVVTANQVDIDAGKLAKAKSHSREVRKFAQQMITDHSGVNDAAVALVAKLKVTPENNATADGLQADGNANLARLKSLRGAAFDRAYVDHEVSYHQTVIEALDKTIIPSARNEELKALLVKVRPAFDVHLEHARHLRASLGKGHD